MNLFVTRNLIAKEQINETDEVLFAGLFAPYLGVKKNYPIVRHGKLAMLSDEKIPWTPSVSEDLYLADVMSFGGNSGSPVFLRLGGVRETGNISGYSYYLLGVMQGYYSSQSDVTVNTAQLHGSASENIGIAGIIPSQKIIDILESPRAKAYIDRVVAQTLLSENRSAEAEPLFKAAIDTMAAFDPKHSDLKAAYIDYAGFLNRVGRHAEAQLQILLANAITGKSTVIDDDKK